MGDESAIEWTDATWNPVVGCGHGFQEDELEEFITHYKSFHTRKHPARTREEWLEMFLRAVFKFDLRGDE